MRLHRTDEPSRSRRVKDCVASESDGLLAITPQAGSTLATLLSTHALRDGEIVWMALKPSVWFILLSSLRFIAGVLILACAALLVDWRGEGGRVPVIEATLFLVFGRLTIAMLQWMGRLYVLTDQRILRVQGVFQVDVFDCPLRKLARVDLVHSTRERIFRLGTIVITPAETSLPIAQWQMVARPRQVLARIADAIDRQRHSGGGPAIVAAA